MKSNMSAPFMCVLANRPSHIYTSLQEEIRHSLRAQHREWVKLNGESLLCDRERAADESGIGIL
jgi:hypothetical protein